MIGPDGVTITTVVDADPEAAFDLFTRDIDRWWRRGPRHRQRGGDGAMAFEPGVGGRLTEGTHEIGRVLHWEPGARLVFTWQGGQFSAGESTEVEVRFEAVAGGTRVTVEHRGWGKLRADHPARQGLHGPAFTGLVGLWWADLLNGLKLAAAHVA